MTESGDAVLTLEATGPDAATLGPASRQRFRASGGTIGRTPDNDWVLPHALVSGHHAEISFANGVFFITDTSTNGVFFKSLTNRLAKGHPTRINSGELIIIQPFRIQVSVSEPASASPAARTSESPAAPIGSPPNPAGPIPWGPVPAGPIPHYDPFEGPESMPSVAPPADEVDPLVALGLAGPSQPARVVPRAENLGGASALGDHFRPPAVVIPESTAPEPPRGGAFIPEDYDPLRDSGGFPPLPADPFRSEPPKPAPRPEPARPQPAAPAVADPGGRSELADLLAGAGLPNAAVPPSLGKELGTILRVVVTGVMDLLRARQQIKDEFRMQATRFRAEDNNSLKFSANVGDALYNLLIKRNAAYLGPVDSFDDAFNDLRNHQIAMLFAMRAAFESMLSEFGPERLQNQFERRVKKKSILGAGPEAEYWELYRERAEDLARDVEETYRKLFGDRFVEAYEEQLERLSTRNRRGKP